MLCGRELKIASAEEQGLANIMSLPVIYSREGQRSVCIAWLWGWSAKRRFFFPLHWFYCEAVPLCLPWLFHTLKPSSAVFCTPLSTMTSRTAISVVNYKLEIN